MRRLLFGNGLRVITNASLPPGPYLIGEHALDECVRQFMAKPASARHLYEIHTTPQPPLVGAVLSQEIVAELARLRDFL